MEFPVDFFKKEERNGFFISSMMKRAWAAQMEVLIIIADICKKYNIPYFADSGTLIGAVRHKGFIPWDDDIDIALLRSDYNRLLQILPDELPYGFVVAGMYAESERLQKAAFVPNLRVIADETLWDFNDYMQYFHGFPYQRVGIDIFVLDTIPDDPKIAAMQRELIRHGIAILREWDNLKESGELQGYLNEFAKACDVTLPSDGNLQNWMWRLIDQIASLYQSQAFSDVTSFSAWGSPYRAKKEWYRNTHNVPFEHIQIAIPNGYHEALTSHYGDYMTPHPYSAAHNYPFYGNMEDALKEQIAATGFTGTVEEFCDKMANGELHI